MFVVLLRFSDKKNDAAQHMDGHQKWIKSGFDDGIFLVVGSINSGVGGAILAHNTSIDDLQRRVADDPFVTANVVTAEIIEIAVAQSDHRLSFLSA